jgi:hypothetical protein
MRDSALPQAKPFGMAEGNRIGIAALALPRPAVE